MKSKKLIIIQMFILLALCIGCAKKDKEEDEKPTEVKETAAEVVFPKISKEQLQEVNKIFLIDFPEEGNVIYYDVLLEADTLGYFYAEIELSEKYYDELLEQIGHAYHESSFDTSCYIPDNIFGTTEKEIHRVFHDVRWKIMRDGEKEIVTSSKYWIYTTKVQNGTFKLLFVSGRC